MAAWNPGGVLLAPRISLFFSRFFHVTHDGLSERGTTRSLAVYQQKVKYDQDKFEALFLDVFDTVEMHKLFFLR